jgi:hypothetical protein
VLNDVELIAPCMPGAQLQEVEGDEYRGIVKVKVGPVTAQYKGAARFLERDEAGRKVVLRAEGRETRGQGNANATITAQMTPDGSGTAVSVVTDLTVTGRVAQFGRGVMADVSTKLLGQFVDCLENKLLVDTPEASTTAEPAAKAETPAKPDPVVPAATKDVASGGKDDGPRDIASEGAAAARLLEEAGDEVAASQAPATGTDGTSGPNIKVIDSPDVEPVDLLHAAGAPVAKRAMPVVAGLTALWLIGLFLRRRRRKH